MRETEIRAFDALQAGDRVAHRGCVYKLTTEVLRRVGAPRAWATEIVEVLVEKSPRDELLICEETETKGWRVILP